MPDYMVYRDLRWRGWFVYSYLLGLLCWVFMMVSGGARGDAHRVIVATATRHADILRTGGFLDPEDGQ